MIYAINYADKNFERNRKYNTKTAYIFGKVDKVIEYTPNDVDEDFKQKNKSIFKYKRGAGLWIWKPYIILKTLEKMNDGDYLFYCDAGVTFINKVQHLIDVFEKDNLDIMLFELPLRERQFTKKETFILMNYNNFDQNQILSGYILLKKNSSSKEIIQKWLHYMCDEQIVSGNHFLNDIQEFEDYVAHREDQSILSILARKLNLPVYRDPSDYGDRPWQYASDKWTYSEKKYENSPYPKIILSNRKSHPMIYFSKECIKHVMYWCKILTKEKHLKKYNRIFTYEKK